MAQEIPEVAPRKRRAETAVVTGRIEKNGPIHRALTAYTARTKFTVASVIEAALAAYLREHAAR
jgi:hypothetical protein